METAESYSKKGYEQLSVTVDLVIFTVIDNELKVLLIKRGQEPFIDFWALPGGFVRINESLEEAALRELKEETGIQKVYLEQLYTFGNPKRDPRGRVVTISYFALVDSTKIKPVVTGEEQIKDVMWFSINKLPKLGFDHEDIVKYALKRLCYKLEYTAIGFGLLPEFFTLTDIQELYEIILNEKLDKRNFRKKILSMNLLETTKKYRKGQHRPALLYKFKKIKPTHTFKKIRFES